MIKKNKKINRKSIAIAIEMLHEASHAIRDVKTTLIFPCLYSFVGVGYVAFWVVVALYIYSVKTKEYKDMPSQFINTNYGYPSQYVYYAFDESMKNALVWHFICLYFLVHVIIYFGFMVLAGTIADWYFSEWDTNTGKKKRGYDTAELSRTPVLESFWRVLRFHVGSLAFGALLITLIRILRAIIKYIEKKTMAKSNGLLRCIFGCVECCLKCCECVFNRINKEGFIFTTMYVMSKITNLIILNYICVKIWNCILLFIIS